MLVNIIIVIKYPLSRYLITNYIVLLPSLMSIRYKILPGTPVFRFYNTGSITVSFAQEFPISRICVEASLVAPSMMRKIPIESH